MDWFIKVLKQYVDFRGRARRTEFWMFTLISSLISIAITILFELTGSFIIDGINSLYSLAVLLPSIAVSVRRMHDVGKSGWFLLIILIPIVGIIWLIVLHATEGEQGSNYYGPDPKNEGYDEIDEIGRY